MKILLVNNNKYREDNNYMTEQISARLAARGVDVLVDDGSKEVAVQGLDRIIVLGGDGTMLRAARSYGQAGIPILGVNMGTVGFLSSMEIYEFDDYLEKYLGGDYSLDTRMMLQVQVYDNAELIRTAYCLNELIIKSSVPKIATINYCIGEHVCTTYKGDGLIMATPAGSTAYSLSAGGPIVDPELEVILITPISGYTFFAFGQKPVVISADKNITINPPTDSDLVISLDGQILFNFEKNHTIQIQKANKGLQLVNVKQTPFFANLNRKLKRNEIKE